jgi:signal transduction histidine kinase
MIRPNGFLGIAVLLGAVALQARTMELRLRTGDPSQEYLCGARGCMPLPLNGQRPFLWVGESPGRVLRLRPAEALLTTEKSPVRYEPDWKGAVDHRKAQHPNHAGAFQEFSVALAHFRAACALVVAAVLALLAALYRLRLFYVAREFDIRLDERANERMRLARDLHDTLLQSCQGALLKLHAVTYRLADHPEAKKELEAAIELAREAVTEGRDAVQGLRSSTMATKDLVRAITIFGEALASDQGGGRPAPDFRVGVEGASRDLSPLVHNEVSRITGEALRNAFRHAGAPRIDVEIRYDKRQFQIHVRDVGKGIDQNILNAGGRRGHHGLPGMRERAELVGGKLVVWSELNLGTEIAWTVPASIAYTKSTATPQLMFSRRGAGGSYEHIPTPHPDFNCPRPPDLPRACAWS